VENKRLRKEFAEAAEEIQKRTGTSSEFTSVFKAVEPQHENEANENKEARDLQVEKCKLYVRNQIHAWYAAVHTMHCVRSLSLSSFPLGS
jgi:hypothetical protein